MIAQSFCDQISLELPHTFLCLCFSWDLYCSFPWITDSRFYVESGFFFPISAVFYPPSFSLIFFGSAKDQLADY